MRATRTPGTHKTTVRILAIMQCMWLRDPERHKRSLAEYDNDIPRREKLRRRMITYALFAGCKTGRVLERTLGENLCEKIIWEEASREVGSHSSAKFDFDRAHVQATIDEFKPDAILALGSIAASGLALMRLQIPVIAAPHPAARHGGVETELRNVRFKLEGMGAI